MRALNVFLSILISVLLAVVVFEVGLRLLGFGPPKTINEFDATLGWSKRPGASAHRRTNEFDVSYEINELGLRDDPMSSPTKPHGTFRVLVLGDSFALGYTVARHNLFVDQLESLWSERSIDVVNAGTEGYSTDQEVAWFLEHGAAFAPDAVLIFPYENDIYWSGQTKYLRKDKPRFEADGTLEERVLEDDAKALGQRFALTRWLGSEAYLDHMWEHPSGQALYKEYAPLLVDAPDFMDDVLARTKGALIALQRECGALGCELVMVPIPAREVFDEDARAAKQRFFGSMPETAWDPNKPVDTYLALADELGITRVDVRDALRAAGEGGEPLYYNEDFHLNAAGNLALAGAVAGAMSTAMPDAFPSTPGALPEPIAEAPEGIKTRYKVFGVLLVALSALYIGTYRDEAAWLAPLKVGGMLALVFTIFFGLQWLVGILPPSLAKVIPIVFVVGILGFVAYKLGRKVATIGELFRAFVMRGHWYLMPLVVVLLTIGSLLVVAASSPLVAPFIYTLF